MVQSMTVAEVIKGLQNLPQNYPLFISVDPEGNAFGSLRESYAFSIVPEDKVAVLYPIETHLDDEVMPEMIKAVVAELDAERKMS